MDETISSHSRRKFLKQSGLLLGAVAVANETFFGAELSNANGNNFRAAIIGHTAKGDYGHGLDVVFNDRENIQVVAVADPNPSGRAKAAEKSKALRQYDDYRVMLEQEKTATGFYRAALDRSTSRHGHGRFQSRRACLHGKTIYPNTRRSG